MKVNVFFLALLVALSSMSFTNPTKVKPFQSGTYGVCNCENVTENVSKIALTLNEDFTFHYLNKEDSKKVEDISGTWKLNGEEISLQRYTNASAFTLGNKWKLDKNENCIKSRKGMAFTRLCLLKPCK
jgi:hypothetical protein